ncbi:hypothetical protein B0H17DRAFT_1124965 [Mycena rosella]|uniref:Uncharacterized protein n=1 Tax=Mycena rosella TaxID=1033263 RepID=A0AAD7GZ16_MYCRO|nr:hypothetical protein B0H17DRAFT_1124965 [Mycena rosella]
MSPVICLTVWDSVVSGRSFNSLACSVGRQHREEANKEPPARLHQNELCILFSHFNTSSEPTWMLHFILVLIHVIGFDGDDGPAERGIGLITMALVEIDFLLHKALETYLIHRLSEQPHFLDYEEYDPHCIVQPYFNGRWSPSLYQQISMVPPPLICFDLECPTKHAAEIGAVVESLLGIFARIHVTQFGADEQEVTMPAGVKFMWLSELDGTRQLLRSLHPPGPPQHKGNTIKSENYLWNKGFIDPVLLEGNSNVMEPGRE